MEFISDNHTCFLFRFLSVLISPLLIPIILSFIYVKGAEATGQLLMSMFVQLTLAEYIYIDTYIHRVRVSPQPSAEVTQTLGEDTECQDAIYSRLLGCKTRLLMAVVS